jgi:hypothetical protein
VGFISGTELSLRFVCPVNKKGEENNPDLETIQHRTFHASAPEQQLIEFGWGIG